MRTLYHCFLMTLLCSFLPSSAQTFAELFHQKDSRQAIVLVIGASMSFAGLWLVAKDSPGLLQSLVDKASGITMLGCGIIMALMSRDLPELYDAYSSISKEGIERILQEIKEQYKVYKKNNDVI